ncbi:hypothetical protein, partial [uncultured Chryseobacterium sp.]|uniref:hypothetical protein n=1 Tax=uncultured Chryseobacterium sp. TaxID=259322 RepID=UPI0025F7BB5A
SFTIHQPSLINHRPSTIAHHSSFIIHPPIISGSFIRLSTVSFLFLSIPDFIAGVSIKTKKDAVPIRAMTEDLLLINGTFTYRRDFLFLIKI